MFDRIVSNPAMLGGKPIIKGTWISVEMEMKWIASGASRDDILKNYPHLSTQDVQQVTSYAAQAVKNEVLSNLDRIFGCCIQLVSTAAFTVAYLGQADL